jgi:hypothetical protein
MTPAFLFDTAPHRMTFNFTENVAATLDSSDLSVQRQGAGSMPPQPNGLDYNSANQQATFTLDGIVPDGDFRATLNSGSVTDVAGNTLVGDPAFDFFFLTGDATHDRHVDANDFTALAQHFNEAAASFSHGNFNYDARTNAIDFNVLANAFGAFLAPVSSSSIARPIQIQSRAVGSLFSDRPVSRDELTALLMNT